MRAFRPMRLPAALLLVLAAATAGAAPSAAADATVRQPTADCRTGSTAQDRATCLKEAAAARAEMRRHRLDNGETPAQLQANALQRCQRVAADDRAACERMAQGEGQRSGSVAEGAVVKQLTVRSPAASAPADAASR